MMAIRKFWRWLIQFLPVRVWLTWAPIGGGPWLHTPAEAAEFLRLEFAAMASDCWLTDEERESSLNVPTFSSEELRRLWFPGSRIERNDYGIKCILIQRRELEREWSGW